MRTTVQTRIEDKLFYPFLESYATLYCKLEKKLFSAYASGIPLPAMKSEFIRVYGITARQFNALSITLSGKISAARECRKNQKANLFEQIKSIKKTIQSLETKVSKYKGTGWIGKGKPPKFLLHQKKRRLANLEERLLEVSHAIEHNKMPLCFGSKKLFKAQFNLHKNGYKNHADWVREWKARRNNQFFIVGSHDEIAGNQSCVLNADGTLRIRAPNSLVPKYGKHVVIPNIKFSYQREILNEALNQKQTLSYRFIKKNNYWYIHTHIERKPSKIETRRECGSLGVDFNPCAIALTETDRFGSKVWTKQIPIYVSDIGSEQAKAAMGDVCVIIVDRAKKSGKPIVIESPLDFRKKKASLREENTKYARMLSQFAYDLFFKMLISRAFKEGVELVGVNPAFSSVIGKIKFMSQYGLSSHQAAALVLARRSQRFSESFPARSAFALPARNRAKHVWSDWGKVKRTVDGKKSHLWYRPLQGIAGLSDSVDKSFLSPVATSGKSQAEIYLANFRRDSETRDGSAVRPSTDDSGNTREHRSI